MKIAPCTSITGEEKIRLCRKFRKNITISSLNNPDRNGQTKPNSDMIEINYEKLREKGDNEFRQTIIHEFMHMAGFKHRERLPIDNPGDGGEYYESPPLRSEICIAGEASFTSGNRICKIENGYYVIEST